MVRCASRLHRWRRAEHKSIATTCLYDGAWKGWLISRPRGPLILLIYLTSIARGGNYGLCSGWKIAALLHQNRISILKCCILSLFFFFKERMQMTKRQLESRKQQSLTWLFPSALHLFTVELSKGGILEKGKKNLYLYRPILEGWMVANGYVLITSWLMLTHIWADVCHSGVQMLAAAASVGWWLLNAVWLTEHSMSIDLHLRNLAVDFWPASITVVEFPGLSPAALKACVVKLSKYPPILRVINVKPSPSRIESSILQHHSVRSGQLTRWEWEAFEKCTRFYLSAKTTSESWLCEYPLHALLNQRHLLLKEIHFSWELISLASQIWPVTRREEIQTMTADIVQREQVIWIFPHISRVISWTAVVRSHIASATKDMNTAVVDLLDRYKKNQNKLPSTRTKRTWNIFIQSKGGKPCGSAHVCTSAARVTVVATLIKQRQHSCLLSLIAAQCPRGAQETLWLCDKRCLSSTVCASAEIP